MKNARLANVEANDCFFPPKNGSVLDKKQSYRLTTLYPLGKGPQQRDQRMNQWSLFRAWEFAIFYISYSIIAFPRGITVASEMKNSMSPLIEGLYTLNSVEPRFFHNEDSF